MEDIIFSPKRYLDGEWPGGNLWKYILGAAIIVAILIVSSCATTESPAKERSSMKRQKEIQKELRANYGGRHNNR